MLKIKGFDYWILANGVVLNARHEVVKPWKCDKGYLKVYLYRNGKRRVKTVHRLVAENYLRNPHPRLWTVVRHKNDDRADPSLPNLEWGKQLHNVRDMIARGRAAWQQKTEA